MEVEGTKSRKIISYKYDDFKNVFVGLVKLQCVMAWFYKVQCSEDNDFLK